MLNRVPDFVGGDSGGTCAAPVIDVARKVQRLVHRVVVIREKAARFADSHVIDSRIGENCGSDFRAGETASDLDFLPGLETGAYKGRNSSGNKKRDEQNAHIEGVEHHSQNLLLALTNYTKR